MFLTSPLFIAVVAFVCGMTLGFGFAPRLDQQAPPLLTCPPAPPCPADGAVPMSPLSRAPVATVEIRRVEENGHDSDDSGEKGRGAGSPCESGFMQNDARLLAVLSKPVPAGTPTSILLGGTAVSSSSSSSSSSPSTSSSSRSFREIGDSMKDDKTLLHRRLMAP
jgi:hypothetical protein